MTVRHVAKRANVSVATVSNVLNRPEKVSAPVLARVHEAIEDLGYVPHMAARQLRGGRSNTLGISVINASNPFFAEIVVGVEQAVRAYGLAAMVGSTHESRTEQHRHLQMFEQFRFDGVLVTPSEDDLSDIRALRSRGVPVVLLDARDDDGELAGVSVDHVAGGRLGAEHLLALGRTRICFASGHRTVRQVADRIQGAEEAVGAVAGASLTVMAGDDLDIGLGRGTGERIASTPPGRRPDAVFAGNDMQAIGIIQALLGAGIRIPQDIAVIGYDDIVFASAAAVPLTSVRQPARLIGTRAAQLLLEIRDGSSAGAGTAAGAGAGRHVTLEPALAVRASTAGTHRDSEEGRRADRRESPDTP